MNFAKKGSLQLRNLRDYCREFGVRGALSFIRQRSQNEALFELPIKGFATPVFCRAEGSDFAVLRQVMGHQDAAIEFPSPPELIIDGGANVGYSSLVFARHYPDATIVGVEPDAGNCEMFRKNCADYSQIHLLEGAIWPRRSMLEITNPDAAAFEFQVGEADGGDHLVRAYTIPEIIEMHGYERVNLLKLDIEGAEHALFTQGEGEWLDRVDVIVVELHDRYIPGCTEAFAGLLSRVDHRREKLGEYDCARILHS